MMNRAILGNDMKPMVAMARHLMTMRSTRTGMMEASIEGCIASPKTELAVNATQAPGRQWHSARCLWWKTRCVRGRRGYESSGYGGEPAVWRD
jgi:hypothetical protein